jgi:membrane-associated HD superfamily phosphohydrolase
VKEEFIRVIAGMYHARGEYPRPSTEWPVVEPSVASG